MENFLTRLADAGGTIDATGTAALTALYAALARTGVWDRLGEIWAPAATNLAGALVKFKVWPGTAGFYTNVNFVAGDYNQTGGSGGLTADGATKYLTGGPPANQFGLDASMWVSIKTVSSGAGQRSYLGSIETPDSLYIGNNPPATNTIGRLGQNFNATYVAAATAGHWTLTRADGNNLLLYLEGTAVANNATVQTAPTITRDQYLFAYNSTGAAAAFTNARLSGAAFGRYLTAAQIVDLAASWTAFDTALSR